MDKKVLTILAVVGVVVLGVVGYFVAKELLSDDTDTNETVSIEQEKETNEEESSEDNEDLVDVDVNTNGGSWDADISSNVPEFKEGNIQSTSTGETGTAKSWVYIFENVDSNDFDNYKEDLEDAGFTNISTYTVDNDSVIMTVKEPHTITVTYSDEEGTIGISITQVLE